MSACPKCKRMAFGSNAVNNRNVAVTSLWITIVLVVISLNLVTSRTPTPTDADIIEFNLGDKLHKSGKVPVYSKVQLRCLLENPMWYKNGVKLNVEQRRMRIVTFEKIKKTDAGVYSCGSDENHGSTLTLHVLPGGEVKSNFAGNMEVYSQISEQADELHNPNESDYYYEKELEENVDLGNEENAENILTREARFVEDVGSPPMWKDGSPLLRTLAKPSGSYVRIPCLATGNPTPNITWTKDDKPIVRSMGEVLYKKLAIRMDDAIPEDSGQYKCTICNEYGCIEHTTKLIILDRVNHKPSIVTAPTNITLTFGRSGEFNCRVLSDLTHLIAWTFKSCDDAICSENKTVSVLKSDLERSDVLKLENVTHENEGWYTCIAANSLGTSAASAYLRVVDELYSDVHLNSPPSRNHPFNGSTLTLPVLPGGEVKSNFAGNMEVYSQISERADELHNHNESDYYYEKELEENVDLDNEENAENIPTDEARFVEDVGSPPMWKDGSSLLRTLAKPSGSYVRIPCLATGNPTPNITWTRDDKPIVRSMGKVLYKKLAIRMDDAIPEDSGQYKCTICNEYGCIEHTTKLIIQDRVNHKPIVLTAPTNITLTFGQSGEFHCGFLSDLTHVIAWTFKSCDDTICSENKNASVLKSDLERSDVLKLENVTHENEGWYTCIAANSLGTSAASAYLRVVDELYSDVPLNSPPSRNHPFWIVIVAVITGLLFLVICVFILFFSRKMKHEKMMKHRMETVHQWTKKVIIFKPSPDPGNPETMVMPIIKIEKQRTTLLQSSNTDPAPFNEYEFPLDSNWEIPRSQLTLGATLGEGAFGRVVMAEATGLGKNQGSCIVAVKMVKEGHTDADMASLVREMEVMKMIGKHINIINLLGCCSQDGPLYVIVEYAPHGNLKDFLKKHRPTSEFEVINFEEKQRKTLAQKDLISFAFQVARGMQYLASRRCIHRDLAARNVLVSDDYVIKIADFGLARDIQDTDYYRKNTNGRLPIKWMAPESLQDKFYDTQSDVWSYGVLLWEIMTFGEQPYPSIMSAEELYNFLMSGQRMERPTRCSLNIYTLMRQCWNLNAHERPTFTDLVESLDKTLTSIANADEEYLDLDLGVQLHLQIDTPPSSDEETEIDTDKYRYITKNTTTIPLLRNGK